MAALIETERLVIRPWQLGDVDDAYAIYAHGDVSRWLSPAMDRVSSTDAMRLVLQQWVSEDDRAPEPTGRWAVQSRADGRVIGALALLYLPPGGGDLEIGWQVARDCWGHGYATEAGAALVRWAMRERGVDELFAVVRPKNLRGASTAKKIGMEWVGETDKYYGLTLQVYRVRSADLLTRDR